MIQHTLETLNNLFTIENDMLLWRDAPKCKPHLIGKECSTLSHGYKVVTIDRIQHRVHRLMYQMHNNINILDADTIIDHVDGNKLNNSKSNLRVCTSSQNSQNRKKSIRNKSGHKCIVYVKMVSGVIEYNYWKVTIQGSARVQKMFPYTDDGLEAAIQFRDNKLHEFHREFANLG